LEVARIFPAGIRVERMPWRCLDFLAVDGEIYDLVVVMLVRVDDAVFRYLAGQFIVDPMVLV
jgi:hypothetical protein